MKHQAIILAVGCAFLVLPLSGKAQNVVVNPNFQVQVGNGFCLGIGGGLVNCPAGVPDYWRAFALGTESAIDLEIVPLAADEIYPGSPETNAVLLRLNGVGIQHGFDSFPAGALPIQQGLDHHAELYAKSANADSSEQSFDFTITSFDAALNLDSVRYDGSLPDARATAEWQLITAPTFRPEAPLAQGFIGLSCDDDGGENAILIALPSVTTSGSQVLPTDLMCTKRVPDVLLSWTSHAAHDSLKVLRDGVEIASLAVDASTYVDSDVPVGDHQYQVVATVGPESGGPSCSIPIHQPPAPGDGVSVDVGATDVEDGLQNSVREEFFDGESEAVTCGPEGDMRDARLNYASEDPTPDTPDAFYYFTVTDPPMKDQRTFHLDLEVFDDPLFAGVELYIQYTNRKSTGLGDTANTFSRQGAPNWVLAGSGEWVSASWYIDEAGFRSFQLGRADFRIGVTGNARVCVDRARLTYLPAPVELSCKAGDGDVRLSWTNMAAYDAIRILRDGAEIASLPGEASSYIDQDLTEGIHNYRVLVTLVGITDGPSCAATVLIVAPGTTVSVNLGDVDAQDGLANVLGGETSDGENESTLCGPTSDRREGRSNLATSDPTPDAPDSMFYFLVTDLAMKSQPRFKLKATVYDDPERAGAPIALQYTVAAATGPEDFPNTFFPLENPPARTLTGSGEWVPLEWEITGACFRSFQQGIADFRLLVTDGGRVCIDRVDLTYDAGAPPAEVCNNNQDDDGDQLVDCADPDCASDLVNCPLAPGFHRGDSNNDRSHNISDPVNTLNVLFLGLGALPCLDAADSNDDGQVNIADPVSSLNVLFLGIGTVPPPLPAEAGEPCGPDPTADALIDSECVYTEC